MKGKAQPTIQMIDRVAEVMKAMSDPMRLKILYRLKQRDYTVNELVEQLECSQANVSRHLGVLKSAGLVGFRQDGASRHYFISDPTVMSICDSVCTTVERKIADDSRATQRR